MSRLARWLRRDERGQDLVEFALSALVLLVLVAGMADFGGLFQNYIILTNAAREGARLATKVPCTTDNHLVYAKAVVDAAISEAATSNVTIATTDVTYAPACPVAGQAVVVTVSQAYPLLYGGLFGFASITLHGRAEMLAYGMDEP